jgi:hypothetical protein
MIKKGLVFLTVVLGLAGCGGYFGQDARNDGKNAVSTLAISGGGYLSSDSANEITPFYFHDTNTGKNWLFYSSDRDSNFDIFYAEMNPDGTFQNPVKMAANINTAGQEVSPVVFYGNASLAMATNIIFISFIRITNGQTNMPTVRLQTNLAFVSELNVISNVIFSRLSLFTKTNVSPDLICCSGNTNWIRISWSVGWVTNTATTNYIGASAYQIHSMNAYLEEWAVGANQFTNYYLMETTAGGKRQLTLGRKGYLGLNQAEGIPLYASPNNDRDPDIDMYSKKVYFSSDRRGTYDLYRYNNLTFDKVNK